MYVHVLDYFKRDYFSPIATCKHTDFCTFRLLLDAEIIYCER